jgi:hypothetical protein
MSTRRKRSGGDPRKGDPDIMITYPGSKVPEHPYPPGPHPGSDELVVITPDPDTLPPSGVDVDEWFKVHPPKSRADHVTRDEFIRRMAGHDVVAQVNADPRTRIIGLADPAAIEQWWESS